MAARTQAAPATRRLAQAAGMMAVATVLSRLLGLVRESVAAAFYGAGAAKGAFVIAYNIPFFAVRLALTGALSLVLIPAITQVLLRRDEAEIRRVVSSIVNLVALIGAGMVALGVLLAPVLVPVFAPGYRDPQVLALTVALTRVMFVSMLFLALSVFATGYLQAHQSFTVPALAPLLFNLVIIAAIYAFHERLGVMGLAVAFVLGLAAQFLVQLPAARRLGFRYEFAFDMRHPAIVEMRRLALPAMLSLAVVEVNAAVDRGFASFLPQSAGIDYVAVLDYAYQLVQAPVGIFAVSIATALFPSLVRHVEAEDARGLRDAVSLGLRTSLFAALPVAALLIVLRVPVVRLLFERGAFAPQATAAVALAMAAYALGLPAISAQYVLTRAYYALRQPQTPLRVGVVMIGLNALGDWAFMQVFGYAGIALSSALVATTYTMTLTLLLRRRLGLLGGREILRAAALSAAAALAAGLAGWAAAGAVAAQVGTRSPAGGAAAVLAGVAAAGAVYVGASLALRIGEAHLVLDLVRRRTP